LSEFVESEINYIRFGRFDAPGVIVVRMPGSLMKYTQAYI